MKPNCRVEMFVIGFIGLFTVVMGGGGLVLIVLEKQVPNEVWMAASAGLGSLGTMLAKAGGAQAVTVENLKSDPVPTKEEK